MSFNRIADALSGQATAESTSLPRSVRRLFSTQNPLTKMCFVLVAMSQWLPTTQAVPQAAVEFDVIHPDAITINGNGSTALNLNATNLAQATDPDTVYLSETSTHNEYRINYDYNNFPGLRSHLIEIVGVLQKDVAQGTYLLNPTSPHCVSPSGTEKGPGIQLGLGIGQVLSQNFLNGIKQVMQEVCNEYYDHEDTHSHSGGIDKAGIIALCVVGTVFACCCIAAMIGNCKNRQNDLNQPMLPPPYVDANAIRPVAAPSSGVTVINVEPDYHHHHRSSWCVSDDYDAEYFPHHHHNSSSFWPRSSHHHHHGSHHHDSGNASVSWGATESSRGNAGVSWNSSDSGTTSMGPNPGRASVAWD